MTSLALVVTNALGGDAILYLDQGAQTLDVRIVNSGRHAIDLTTHSRLAVRLAGIAAANLTAPGGWSATRADGGWTLRCDADTTDGLPAGGAIAFTVSGLDPRTVQRAAAIEVDHDRIDDTGTLFTPIAIENRAPAGLATLALTLAVEHDAPVDISEHEPIENRLTLILGNPGDAPILPPTLAASGSYVTIEALVGDPGDKADGYAGLATIAALRETSVAVSTRDTARWSADPANPIDDGDGWIRWKFTPAAPILDGHESIAFTLSRLICTLPPGSTQIVLRHHDIPGYRNGAVVAGVVRRYPPIGVRFGTVSSPNVTVGEPVELAWRTVGAASVTLSGDDAPKTFVGGDARATASYYVTPSRVGPTTYTLTPYDAAGRPLADEHGNRVVAPQVTVTAKALAPVIVAFSVDQEVVARGGTTRLRWQVDHASAVRLQLVEGEGALTNEADLDAASGSREVPVATGALTYALTAYPIEYQQGDPVARATVTLWAFDSWLTRAGFLGEQRDTFYGLRRRIDFLADGRCRYRASGWDREGGSGSYEDQDFADGRWTTAGLVVTAVFPGRPPAAAAWSPDSGLFGQFFPVIRTTSNVPRYFDGELRQIGSVFAGRTFTAWEPFACVPDARMRAWLDDNRGGDGPSETNGSATQTISFRPGPAGDPCRGTYSSAVELHDSSDLAAAMYAVYPGGEGIDIPYWPGQAEQGSWTSDALQDVVVLTSEAGARRSFAWHPLGIRALQAAPAVTRSVTIGDSGPRQQTVALAATILTAGLG